MTRSNTPSIAEKTNNWQLIIAIWAVIALLGTIIVLAFAKKYRKTMM